MPTQCLACANLLPDDAPSCSYCGATIPPSAPPVQTDQTGQTDQPIPALFASSTLDADRHLEGLGGWLILVGLRLVLSPLLVLRALFAVDLPVLTNSRYDAVRQTFPLLHGLVTFEAITNLICFFMLLWLLYLFFTRKRAFPAIMILFMVFQIVALSSDHIALISVYSGRFQHGFPRELIQVLGYGAIWIPYFLVSRRVKATFTR